MAFNTAEGRAEYTASGGQTVFSFVFKIFTNSDIKVYQTPNGSVADDVADLLTITTDYTVTIDGDNGGTVTLVSGATAGDTIVLVRSLTATRTVDYQDNGDLFAATIDNDQNYQTYLIVDGYTQLERALLMGESLVGVSLDVPSPVADSYLKWNATADALENDTTIPDNLTLSQTAATTATTQAGIATTQAGLASTSATNAQLRAWEAEAERLTADSYATEAEDVFVKTYFSDGDGTFTATDTTEYSALHWAAKSALSAQGDAVNISYDNTTSGLTAVNVQTAIDELSLEKLSISDIHSATSKTTPVGADELALVDSAASNVLKKLTIENLSYSIHAGENMLINSNGLINNRAYVSGTATSGANQYTVDRWRVVTSGQALTFSTTNGVTTFTAPAGGVEQVIHYQNCFAGAHTLSIGGTATATVSESADNVTYTTVTPVAGIYTMAGGKYVKINFANGTFELPQFTLGRIVRPYQNRPTEYERYLCNAYLPTIKATATNNIFGQGQENNVTTSARVSLALPSTAITAPTGITVSAVGDFTANGSVTNLTLSAITFTGASQNNLSLTLTGTGGTANQNILLYSANANAKILCTGCEL